MRPLCRELDFNEKVNICFILLNFFLIYRSQSCIVTLVTMKLKTEYDNAVVWGVQMTNQKNMTELRLAVEGGRGPPELERDRSFARHPLKTVLFR